MVFTLRVGLRLSHNLADLLVTTSTRGSIYMKISELNNMSSLISCIVLR